MHTVHAGAVNACVACARAAQVIKAHEERREWRGARLKPVDIGVSLTLITIRRAQLHARRLGS